MTRAHLLAQLAILGGLALLGACGSKGGGEAAANTAAQDTIITPAQFPTPKAGYWAETNTDNGGSPQTHYECENGKPISADDLGSGCTSVIFKKLADGSYSVEVSCTSDGQTKNTRMVFKGDPNSAFTLDGVRTSGSAGQPTTTETHHEDAHFAGPCPST